MIVDAPGGAVLSIRVMPRARRSQLDGVRGSALLVRLAAAPVDGAANDALLDLLSEALSVPRRSLEIISGVRGREKRVAIRNLSAEDVRHRLNVR